MNAFLVLAFLILLSSFFSLAEMALASARRSRLQQMADDGDPRAATAITIKDQPSRLLAATQTGITAAALLMGIYGESAFSSTMTELINRVIPAIEAWSSDISFILTIIIVTAVTIIFSEIVPKRIAIAHPERVAAFCAPYMLTFITVLSPAVHALSWLSDRILALLPWDYAPAVTSIEDIMAYVNEGERSGTLAPEERHMLSNVLRLDERHLASIMSPIAEIDWLNLMAPREDNLRVLRESPHSQLPVCKNNLQHVIGIAQSHDILQAAIIGEIDLAEIPLTQPLFVPVTLTLIELLRTFRKQRVTLALVVNEFGNTEGIVTVDDLVLSLVGDMMPMADDPEDMLAARRSDGSWLLDGLLAIDDMKDKLEIGSVPNEELGSYHTVGGFVLSSLGRIPRKTERFSWAGWDFEVIDVDRNRVDQVLATRQQEPAADEEQ